jgi:hypothetical protein
VPQGSLDPFTGIHGTKDDPCLSSPIGNADWVQRLVCLLRQHSYFVDTASCTSTCGLASWMHLGWGEAKRDSSVDDDDDVAGAGPPDACLKEPSPK